MAKVKTDEELIEQTRNEKIRFKSKSDAEKSLDALGRMVEDYGFISVGDVKEMAGKTATQMDDRWGWRTLENVGVKSEGSSWVLTLPLTENIS